ncbi:MAG: hypothetical protein RLZ55_46 [Actinomycetota bacterium]
MTSLDPQLLSILACPCEHHAPVAQVGQVVKCTRCATTFPISDGIPVMLLDEATAGPRGIGEAVEPAGDA